MLKRYLLIVFILIFSNLIFAKENRMFLKQYDLNPIYEMDSKILKEYGNLWAIYYLSDPITVNGSERTPIEEISFYYKSNDNFIFLGKYDKYGVYDKTQKLLFKNPYSNSFIGYIEIILEDPFYTGQYAFEGKFGPGGFEPYVKLKIDFSDDTLSIDL